MGVSGACVCVCVFPFYIVHFILLPFLCFTVVWLRAMLSNLLYVVSICRIVGLRDVS